MVVVWVAFKATIDTTDLLAEALPAVRSPAGPGSKDAAAGEGPAVAFSWSSSAGGFASFHGCFEIAVPKRWCLL